MRKLSHPEKRDCEEVTEGVGGCYDSKPSLMDAKTQERSLEAPVPPHTASRCPRSKRNNVQTADEETRLAAFDVRQQCCNLCPRLAFTADAICSCGVESR